MVAKNGQTMTKFRFKMPINEIELYLYNHAMKENNAVQQLGCAKTYIRWTEKHADGKMFAMLEIVE